MNLKKMPTEAKKISQVIFDRLKKGKDAKDGVDLNALAKKLAKRNLEKEKTDELDSSEDEE